MTSALFVDGLSTGELMTYLVENFDWIEVRLDSDKHDSEIRDWLSENCVSAHIARPLRYVFQNETDAIAFLLKWR